MQYAINPALPSRELLQLQADWLSDARARILRLAEIARRKTVLDLGAGYGIITKELRQRTTGTVIALDRSVSAISDSQPCVCANVRSLPFQNQSFDLVFSQNVLLWIRHPEDVVQQVVRVLKTGGVWVLFEPDYGAMIEYPRDIETSSIWIEALKRSGADPLIGRKMPPLLTQFDLHVTTELLPRLVSSGPERFDFLKELKLTASEKTALKAIQGYVRDLSPDDQVSHLPYFLIIAERR